MSKSKLVKVLQVVSDLRSGGIEKLVFDLVSKIDRDRFAIEICCARGKRGQFLEPIQDAGIPIRFFGDYRRSPRSFFSDYRKFLASGQFNVVHSHLNHWSCLFLHAPFKLGIPLRIVHYHSDFSHHCHYSIEYMMRRIFGNFSRRYSNKIIGISNACLESVCGYNWRCSDNIERIYNGIDLAKFTKKRDHIILKQEFGLQEESLVVGHVGQFRKEKNHSFLVSLAEEVCRRNNRVIFFFVGEGPLLEQIRREVQERGLREKVVFTGARPDVPELLHLMDIFVFPSLWEGFGLAVLEAQAAGLPVVVSANVPGEIPLLKPSVSLPLNDLHRWVHVCEDLLDKVRHENKMPEEDILTELRGFSIEAWIEQIERLYSQAVA